MASAGDSHIGLVRSENQDRHDSFISPLGVFHLVADGMGGHSGGSKAASMVVEGYRSALSSPGPSRYRDAILAATQRTNHDIHRLGTAGVPEFAGMGSTVVMALFRGWELVVAHIGDSRAYLARNGRVLRLTRDHTAVQHLVDLGFLSESEAVCHPSSNLLTRALGGEPSVEIEISPPVRLQSGDRVVLCTDGLSGRVDDLRIAHHIARSGPGADSVVQSLITLALSAGGTDNVTVRCIEMQPPDSTVSPAPPSPPC